MTSYTDAFSRANETPLVAPWATGSGDTAMNLSTNAAVPSSTTLDCCSVLTGTSWGPNQSSTGNLTTDAVSLGGPGLVVRHDPAAQSYYRFIANHNGTNNCRVSKFSSGSFASLVVFTLAWVNGDQWTLKVTGPPDVAVLTVSCNGVPVQSFTDSDSIASGIPGVAHGGESGVVSSVDNWIGTDYPPDTGVPITAGSGTGVDTSETTYTLTGTVAKNGTTTLTGTNTLFLSELKIGTVIRVPGTSNETRTVATITSDTSLTVTVAFTNTASGQTALRVVQRQVIQWGTASISTPTTVTAAAADTMLKAASTQRLGLTVYNDSTANLYLKYGTGASSTSYTVRLSGGGYWEMPVPIYTGQINGNWTVADGSAIITELAA